MIQKMDLSQCKPKSPIVLTVAYLAWLFDKIAKSIEQDYPASDLRIQLPVPLDSTELRDLFFQVVQAAWRISLSTDSHPVKKELESVPSLKSLYPDILELLKEPLIHKEERFFDVLPEAIAPILTLKMDPDRDPGIYFLIDTGDGTTEISVIDLAPIGDEDIISCYFNRSIRVGAAELQKNITAHRDNHKLLSDLDASCREVHFRGYSKVKDNHNARRSWSDLSIVLSGGGTLRPEVGQIFQKSYDCKLQSYFQQFSFSHTIIDGNRIDVGMSKPKIPINETRFYVVARGLLIEKPNWPIWFSPDKIEQTTPTERAGRVRPHWEQ